MIYVELVIFYMFIYLLVGKIKNIFIRNVLLILNYLVGVIDIIAILTKNTHIDISFISNIDKTILKIMFSQFLKETLLISCIVLVGIYCILFKDKIIREKIKRKEYLIMILFLLNIFLPNSVFKNIYILGRDLQINNSKISKQDIWKNLGKNIEEYKNIDEIKVQSGKNIVMIYLESIEYGFLNSDIFENLTPTLTKLSKDNKEWTFFDRYIQTPGAGWTMAGLFTTQTGMPMLFGLHGNSVFNNIDDLNIISVGKILEKAKYEQRFINGCDLNFAGVGKFFEISGYKAYGNQELDKNYSRSEWGVRDKDIFEEAKKQYLELQKLNKPFNLTILTVDTHFPVGVKDERFNKIVNSNLNGVEYSVNVVDYLIKDFITFMKEQQNYENTIIYIMPDHLIMGSEQVTPVVKKLNTKKRNLWLLTNSKNINKNKEITFYDIPKIILNGANIKTDSKFIIDLLPNLNPYDNELLQKLQNLNLSLTSFNKIREKVELKKEKNKLVIYLDGKKFDTFSLENNMKKYYSIDSNFNIKGKFNVNKNSNKSLQDYSSTDLKLEVFLDDKNLINLKLIIDNDISLLKKEKKLNELVGIGNYSLNKKEELSFSINDLEAIQNISRTKSKLKQTTDLNSYLFKLKEINDKNIVGIISIQDEGSVQYQNYKKSFDKFKLLNLSGKSRQSYLSIFKSDGKVIYEKLGDRLLNKKIKLENMDLELTSAGFTNGNISKIIIDGLEYSKNMRGFNIVILETDKKIILDSFNVDTYADSNLIIKR